MFETLDGLYTEFTGWLFELAIQPLLYAIGAMDWAEDAYNWLDFFLFGLLQIVVIMAVCWPLEQWKPVERWKTRSVVWTDVFYTVLSSLGLLPLIAFVLLYSAEERIFGWIADSGFIPPTIEEFLPWLRDWPLVALAIYVVILDFGEYWRHRFQHTIPWWWALHSVHHAQKQMTYWTDARNHIIDDAIAAVWFGVIALAIGVPPGQFPVIVMLLKVIEALSHANARISFGWLGERLVVSPRFHRVHHGILSYGEHGKNYAVLMPVWDWMFRTANFDRSRYPETGDPTAPEALVTGGWLRQQWAGSVRLWRALTKRRRPATAKPVAGN
ncbi:sterol desaturase family protein [Acetobacteraceae bacterium H6797]|nr:sterol desaturase family protein [Acetobacteraceae bacterium H6797]